MYSFLKKPSMQIIILLWPSETCLLIFCKTIYIFIHKYHFSAQSLQSCLTLCDPMGCSLPGSSVHGILQEEYWSELPCRLPAALLDTGSNLYLQQLFWSDPVQNQDCLNLVKTVFFHAQQLFYKMRIVICHRNRICTIKLI